MEGSIKLRFFIIFLAIAQLSFSAGIGVSQVADIYYGNLHSHTSHSDGVGTPADAYAYARDSAGVDFLAVTDHLEQLDDGEWGDVKQKAIDFTEDSIFVAIHGFEWGGGITQVGHICTWGTQEKPGLLEYWDLSTFYGWLEDQPFALAQFNHPCREGSQDDFDDFAYSGGVDEVIQGIEVGNKDDGHEVFEEHYYRALDAGWHLAPTFGQDNHSGDWGDRNEHRTAIIAEALTSEALFSAIAGRNVYSTEDKNLRLWFYGNSELMGAILANEPISFSIQVEDPDSGDIITKLELRTNGGVVIDSLIVGSTSVFWEPSVIPQQGIETYYLVRVTSADSSVAFSAPIWASAEPGVEEREMTNDEFRMTKLEVYPNPFTTVTSVKWTGISEKQKISVQIYDLGGKLVKTLATNHLPLTTAVVWDGTDNNNRKVENGVYFVKLTGPQFIGTKKVVLIR